MSAPARPPLFCDPQLSGDAAIDPAQATAWLIDDLVSTATAFPHWLAEDAGTRIALRVVSHSKGARAVIGWRSADAEGTVTLVADGSGWLLVTGTVGGETVFTAYLDRPYEEYEMWPPGARPGTDEEAPGRMGKHRAWVSLRAEAWPALRPLANAEGGVNFAIDGDS